MLRLIAFLVTGFWPSAKSLLAVNRRLDALEQRVQTLTKKHNTLAGSYYAETEPADELRSSNTLLEIPGLPEREPFPEDEFDRLREQKRSLRHVPG